MGGRQNTFYAQIHKQSSNTSTRSFLGLNFRSGSLRRMEHIPPFPSYLHTPAQLKETQNENMKSYLFLWFTKKIENGS